jgi:hypothetical protein
LNPCISIACARGVHIAHQVAMLNGVGRLQWIARIGRAGAGALMLMTLTAPAAAQADGAPQPHVRGDDDMRRLIDDAASRSPAIHEWIDRLQELDVTVYVRTKTFTQRDLEGRVALLSRAGSHRYLVIELACGRTAVEQMATLGHELFHAIEIAEEPSVVNADTLAAFYTRIGIKTGDSGGVRTFETGAAAAAGLRARRQLLTTTRNSHGT